MSIEYPQGGIPGMIVSRDEQEQSFSSRTRYYRPPDTFRVQLVPTRPPPRGKISDSQDVLKYIRDMEDYDREYAKILHLDTKNQVIGIETISIGNISASIVHPRESIKSAVLNNSASVIFVHNHPSGICEPSQDDFKSVKMLADAFDCVGIRLLDSFIIGKGCYYSFREMGTMPSSHAYKSIVSDFSVKDSEDIGVKITFIINITTYITARDIQSKNRAAEDIKRCRYYVEWYRQLSYCESREEGTKRLEVFFNMSEQELVRINTSIPGVFTEYLDATSGTKRIC